MSKLSGKTLIKHKIDQLRRCKLINRIIVGSDSDIILNHAKECGAEPVKRPDYFCDERLCSANEMIENMCNLFGTDIVVWAHCTNPLISYNTYDDAIQAYMDNYPEFDSLISVLRVQEHLWNHNKTPLNYNPYAERHVPASELKPLYKQDGGIFIQRHCDFLRTKYFFGRTPLLYEIKREEYCDINDQFDLDVARMLISARDS
jgi:CMP-N-acetylneuraminic acid synthetase